MVGKTTKNCVLFPFWLPIWIVFVCFAVLYAVWTPPFMYPDEPTHLVGCLETLDPAIRERLERDVLELMSEHHFWARAGVESPVIEPEKFYQAPLLRIVPTQASKPFLYYQIAARVVGLADSKNLLVSLFLLRLFGVFLASISVAIFGVIVKEIFTEQMWQVGAMTIVFIPQYVYMAGAVNPMTTAWITGSMLILSGLWLLKPERRYQGWFLLLAACAIAPLTHPSSLALLPLCLTAAILGRKRLRRHKIPGWLWPLAGSVSALAAFIITLRKPFLVRSTLLRSAELIHGLRVYPDQPAINPGWFWEFSRWFWRSTILNFGWLTVEGNQWIYTFYTIIVCAIIVGWFLRILGQPQRRSDGDPLKVTVLVAGFLFMLLAATGPYFIRSSLSQGRYLFSAWPVIGILSALGLKSFIPVKYHLVFIGLFLFITCFICSWSLYFVLITRFYF